MSDSEDKKDKKKEESREKTTKSDKKETRKKKESNTDEDFLEDRIKKTLISLLGLQEKPPEKEKKETFLDLLRKRLLE